jgi:hypothetical protein
MVPSWSSRTKKMSQKLWVAHETPAKTFIDKVSIEDCEYVDDFLKEIRNNPELAIPSKSPLTLFQPDGKEIDVGDSPADFVNGNSRAAPLIVKSFALGTGATSVDSPLLGQVFSVSINQSKLIKKYLTPVGSSTSSSTPVATSVGHTFTRLAIGSVSVLREHHRKTLYRCSC